MNIGCSRLLLVLEEIKINILLLIGSRNGLISPVSLMGPKAITTKTKAEPIRSQYMGRQIKIILRKAIRYFRCLGSLF